MQKYHTNGFFPPWQQTAFGLRTMVFPALVALLPLLGFQAFCQTAALDSSATAPVKTEEREAMDIGGLVTLDYNSPIDNFKVQTLQIGRIELRAVVNVNQNVKGFITLLSEGDLRKIRIYQAAADLTLNKYPVEFIAGQQIFNHGLMTTRLINYPLGYSLVLPNQPGVSGIYTLGAMKLGLAGLMVDHATEGVQKYVVSTSEDTVALPGAQADTSRYWGAIVSADYSWSNGSGAHASTLVSHGKIDMDLACALLFAGVTVDAELYSRLKEPLGGAKASTYCAGASYAVTENFSVAIRNDGISEKQFIDMTMLYTAGCVYKLFGDCYIAFEYDYQKPPLGAATNAIAVEFGLQSTLKLPGFQRKSLTQN